MSLRGFVEQLHRKAGLSQTEIARESGLSQGLIYKILTGIGKPQMRTYQKLASAFPEAWAEYLKRHPAFRSELAEAFGWATDPNRIQPGLSRRGDRLLLLHSALAIDQPSQLGPEAQQRYRQRVREVMERVSRELTEYKETLEREFQRTQNRRPKKSDAKLT